MPHKSLRGVSQAGIRGRSSAIFGCNKLSGSKPGRNPCMAVANCPSCGGPINFAIGSSAGADSARGFLFFERRMYGSDRIGPEGHERFALPDDLEASAH